MSQPKPKVGTVGWIDLVVDDAEGVRDFYADVVGWEPESVGVGDYDDFNMKTPGDGKPTAGVGTDGRYTMIRDPAGAVCALFQAAG